MSSAGRRSSATSDREKLGSIPGFSRLPSELIGEILSAYPFATTNSAQMAKPARDELTQLIMVSRAWRKAALDTHQLWATVSLDGDDCRNLSYQAVVTWLNRAGNLRRNLRVYTLRFQDCPPWTELRTCPKGCALNQCPALVRLMVEGGGSFDNADFNVRSRCCLETFFRLLSNRIESQKSPIQLRALRLCTVVQDWREYQLESGFLSHSPHLTNIHLIGTGSIASLAQVEGFLGRLTNLHFCLDTWTSYETLSTILATLSKCVNLQELGLIYMRAPSDPSAIAVIRLAKVTCLRVHAHIHDGTALLAGLLNHLHFPSLTTMEVTGSNESSLAFAPFFQRHPHIKVFQCWNTNEAPLQAALFHLPSLTHLSIGDETTLVDCFIYNLKQSLLWGHELLPRIEHLKLSGLYVGFDMLPVFEFLLARRPLAGRTNNVTAGIREVVLEFITGPAQETHTMVQNLVGSDEVRALRGSGMAVTIRSVYDSAALFS